MTTVGDLFVRVTAKDANFQRSMRNVQGSISRVTNSVGRMAGMFGLAFGMGSLVSKTIESAAKYSNEFAKEMHLATRDAQLFWIAAGQGIGPALAEASREIRKAFGTTEQWRDTWAEIGEHAVSFVELIKMSTYNLRIFAKIWKTIGEYIGMISATPHPKSPNNPYTQRTSRAELEGMQQTAASQAADRNLAAQTELLKQISKNTETAEFR